MAEESCSCTCNKSGKIRITATIKNPWISRNIHRKYFRCGVIKKYSSINCFCKHLRHKLLCVQLNVDPAFAGVLLKCVKESEKFAVGFTVWVFEKWKEIGLHNGNPKTINTYLFIIFNEKLNKSTSGFKSRLTLRLLPARPQSIEPDLKWCERLAPLLVIFIKLSDVMAWLSTLGGAYSSLGEHSSMFSQKACDTSLRQLLVARQLNNPVLEAQCQVFLAMSLVQRGHLKQAKKMIRKQYSYALSNGIRDSKLIASCQAVWTKIKFIKEQKQMSKTIHSKS